MKLLTKTFKSPLFFVALLLIMVMVAMPKLRSEQNNTPEGLVITDPVTELDSFIQNLYNKLELKQKGLAYNVFEQAVVGYYNLKNDSKLGENDILSIGDFSKSSTKKRFFVIDLKNEEMLYQTYVSHGRNSGNEYARKFSNTHSSYMSSLGFYVTAETYTGKHGHSLMLDGMDESFNDNARSRAIVMHGAEYANPEIISWTGRLGRSLGCPALPMDVYHNVIETIKEGTVLFLFAKDESYASQTRWTNKQVAAIAYHNNAISTTVAER